ncbi:MAG: NADH:ubiquinone reductase (Na(+)-transporting) subunit B [Gammaproteobacteria bacterium]
MKDQVSFADKLKRIFAKGGALESLYPLYEGADKFLLTPGSVTRGAPHVRDFMDLKRMMITVVLALLPPVIMALYNTGLQANLALREIGIKSIAGWRGDLSGLLGIGVNPDSILDNMVHGALYFLPIYLLTLVAGGFWEILFASLRKRPISEGFLVTSLLFVLILPPDIPWWQVMLGISFGVVVGKEIFGGVGMNVLNPALVGRCFLYFSYPGEITGNTIWVAVDSYTRATPLAQFAEPEFPVMVNWQDAFLGFIPGSMGETSTLACLIGAAILIISQIGSWRIMLSTLIGMVVMASVFNLLGNVQNPMSQVTPLWHLVVGGFAFGTVYMATDPVSAAHTHAGQVFYGLLIGFLTVLVRVINPGFVEGIMLAILFANVFAPAIDRIFVSRNIKRRLQRQVRDAKK